LESPIALVPDSKVSHLHKEAIGYQTSPSRPRDGFATKKSLRSARWMASLPRIDLGCARDGILPVARSGTKSSSPAFRCRFFWKHSNVAGRAKAETGKCVNMRKNFILILAVGCIVTWYVEVRLLCPVTHCHNAIIRFVHFLTTI
jgi:hypothetical protein